MRRCVAALLKVETRAEPWDLEYGALLRAKSYVSVFRNVFSYNYDKAVGPSR